MADYDSDSSGIEDVETGVILGYASKESTGDDFSQLGGHPVSRTLFVYLGMYTDIQKRPGLTQMPSPLELSPSAKSATDTSTSSSN